MSDLSRDIIDCGIHELDDAIYDLAVAHSSIAPYDKEAGARIQHAKESIQAVREDVLKRLEDK